MITHDAIRALIKASFSGDRSAAGRYAAEQRWKDHAKETILQQVAIGFESSGYDNSGTVWATDKETGKVVGALQFSGNFIGKVYVVPQFRRKGIASYLYEEAKKRNGGLEMKADDYTVSGAAFMSAVTGETIYQTGEQSSFSWKPWLEELERNALNKASFSGDRSAAGRYAAEQRWKNHVKMERKPTGFLGVSKPQTAENLDRKDQKVADRYPPHMEGRQLTEMMREDMAAMYRQERGDLNPFDGPSLGQIKELENRHNRRLAKETLCRDIAKGLLDMSDEQIEQTLQELEQITPISSWRKQKWLYDKSATNKQVLLEDMVSKVIHQWAESSNDSSVFSLAIQQIVAQEFNLKDTTPASAIDTQSTKHEQEATQKLENNPSFAHFVRAVVQQQYANTQAYFAAKGIKEITLFRGLENINLAYGLGRQDSIESEFQLRPLSSFTADREIADRFAWGSEIKRGKEKTAVVISVRIPVSQVFSTPFTGIGCLPEQEIVVLGRPTNGTIFAPNKVGIGQGSHGI